MGNDLRVVPFHLPLTHLLGKVSPLKRLSRFSGQPFYHSLHLDFLNQLAGLVKQLQYAVSFAINLFIFATS